MFVEKVKIFTSHIVSKSLTLVLLSTRYKRSQSLGSDDANHITYQIEKRCRRQLLHGLVDRFLPVLGVLWVAHQPRADLVVVHGNIHGEHTSLFVFERNLDVAVIAT